MIKSIKFNGWFQCRLATDPDPADEPRGVSGYMIALPGEPDFDRIVRFQPEKTFWRTHTPEVGVTVKAVFDNSGKLRNHSLIGAKVSLPENAVFKGENEIIAPGGYEPILPFSIKVSDPANRFLFTATCPDSADFIQFPFTRLWSSGFIFAMGRVSDATGIPDIKMELSERRKLLSNDLKTATDIEQIAISYRLSFLESDVASRFFPMMLSYNIPLNPHFTLIDPDNHLPFLAEPFSSWDVDFWLGAWDPDACCGFVEGYLNLSGK